LPEALSGKGPLTSVIDGIIVPPLKGALSAERPTMCQALPLGGPLASLKAKGCPVTSVPLASWIG
jgi:hypothetical protein